MTDKSWWFHSTHAVDDDEYTDEGVRLSMEKQGLIY